MAVTKVTEFAPARVTLPSTANNARGVVLPYGTKFLDVQFLVGASDSTPADGKVAFTGTDDAAIGAAYLTVGVGVTYTIRVPFVTGQQTTLYLASSFVSAIAEILPYR